MIFYKYCAIGNDFVVTNECMNKETIIKICDRNFGVGADGVLSVVLNKFHIIMRIYNMDGSQARMCGNGLRIVGKYLRDVYGIIGENIEVFTLSGVVKIDNTHDEISIYLNRPKIDGKINEYVIYDAGNKHALKIVDTLYKEELIKEAREPDLNDLNVTHINIINESKVNIITHERGVGITLGCGSASASAFAYLNNLNCIQEPLDVTSPGGTIRITKNNNLIKLTSRVDYIFKGEINDGYFKTIKVG